MADYVRDPAGIVHVVLPYGDGEMTMCWRDWVQADGDTQGFEGVETRGPATCLECLSAFTRLQLGLKDVRFTRDLVRADADGRG